MRTRAQENVSPNVNAVAAKIEASADFFSWSCWRTLVYFFVKSLLSSSAHTLLCTRGGDDNVKALIPVEQLSPETQMCTDTIPHRTLEFRSKALIQN